jgi:hypothetical protein
MERKRPAARVRACVFMHLFSDAHTHSYEPDIGDL